MLNLIQTRSALLLQKSMIIEEIINRQLMTYEKKCELTETDHLMIARLVKEQKLTNDEIVNKILEYHK